MERQPRRRRRPALACHECRRRKIKCDRNDPCIHCIGAKTQCRYTTYANGHFTREETQHGSSGNPALTPSTNASVHLAHRSAAVYESPKASEASAETAEQNDDASILGENGTQSQERIQDVDLDHQDRSRRQRNLERSSVSSPIDGLSKTGRHILESQSGLQDSQIILNKTRILGWSHWMGQAPEFRKVFSCYIGPDVNDISDSYNDAEIRPLIAQMSDLLQQCKGMAKKLKGGRPSRSLSSPQFGLVPPSREVADKMAALYFGSFESTHRILHIPSFWAEYQRFWESPENVPTNSRLKILLVIGIGSSLCGHGDKDPEVRNMVHRWIYGAQTWLSGPTEKDRLDVTGIQIHCLTMLARQIFSIGGDLVWMSMGSLIHRAMQTGFHRDPKYLPAMSVLQAEIRRRLWATVLELVVQSSLDSAMPPRISFEEFDTEAPSNLNDDEIDEATRDLQPHPKTTYTATSIQLVLYESLPTRLRVVQLLNGLHSKLSYVDVLALSSEITDAYRECSSFMKRNEKSGVTPFHRNSLDYLVRRFLIPLHCQFASKGRTNPLFHYSLKVALDVAMSIISPEQDEAFSNLMAIGGGLFREAFRYACAVISAELIVQVEADSLDGTLSRKSHQREVLKQGIKDMMAFSIERIKHGETNIKSHMFLSMILAQAEAIEAGVSCELKIAQSAVESLVFCHGLLQTQLDTESAGRNDAGLTPMSFDSGQDGYRFDVDMSFFFSDVGFT